MATEVWFRNPERYARECSELLVGNLVWWSSYVEDNSIDPLKFADLFIPPQANLRILLIDHKGTMELRRGAQRDEPHAVYPTWDYEIDDIATLEDLLAKPVGDDMSICANAAIPSAERPVYGQEHRVVITGSPPATMGVGRRFLSTIRDLQREYPEAIIHVHGSSSFRVMFGLGFRSVDWDPRFNALDGCVYLPNGKTVNRDQAARYMQWITLLGMKPVDLSTPRARTIYNIKSVNWASEHWDENVAFKSTGKTRVDPNAISPKLPTVTGSRPHRGKGTVGDKVTCDSCSLSRSCKYFRTGSVCSLPGSEPEPFVRMWETRDADQIIDNLGQLLEVNQQRLVRALEDEQAFGGQDEKTLDGDVTRLVESIFDRGVKLAKLLDPKRFSPGAKVAVNIGPGGSTEIGSATPQALVGGLVRELKELGYADEEITPELIEAMLQRANAIEVPAIQAKTDDTDVDSF